MCTLEGAGLSSSPPHPAPQIQAQIPTFPGLPQMCRQISDLSALLLCLMLDLIYGSVPAALDFEVTGGQVTVSPSIHPHHSSVFPNDCYSYVLFANITIHQTCTIQRQSHLWPSMTHEWIVQSVCSFRRHCKWQTDCKERAEKLLRIFLENCSSIKRGGGYFLSFLENVTWPHHYEVPLKSVGRSIHYFNTHYTSSP